MNRRFIRGLLAGLCLTLALGFGSCENPAGEGGNENGGKSAAEAREAADAFFTAHSAVLDKSADMLGLDDEAPVTAALEAYKGLSAETKDLLAEEKAHLDRLKVRIEALKNAADKGFYYTAADLGAWLAAREDNTPDSPYTVRYGGNEPIKTFYSVLEAAGKYAALDLSQSGVRGFSFGAEEGRAFIVSLVLPDSLTEIPDGIRDFPVFAGFTNLKTLYAAGLIRLGDYAFQESAPGLTTVDLPKAESIGTMAFYKCSSLAAINLPEAVTISRTVFRHCTSLTTVNLPKAVTIGGGAFEDCTGLTTVTLPELVEVETSLFGYCTSLTRVGTTSGVSLPKAVTINDGAFQGCTSLISVYLLEAETIINAFRRCTSLTNVTLPKAASLGGQTFTGCRSLDQVTLGLVPPDFYIGKTTIFESAAVNPGKIITIRAPYPEFYEAAGTPWSDKVNKSNQAAGYFWDNTPATRDNLTVNLVQGAYPL
jgi:hypothetical protein